MKNLNLFIASELIGLNKCSGEEKNDLFVAS